jgi:catechol 2,3-dioxygenase-like lactoylglutathione lyase family enzyme
MKRPSGSNVNIARKSPRKRSAPRFSGAGRSISNCWNRRTIAKFLEKNPAGGIHHVAFGTDDVGAQLQQASGAGVKLIHEKPFPGAGGKLVAFLHPKSTFGVLTELCAPQPEAATH